MTFELQGLLEVELVQLIEVLERYMRAQETRTAPFRWVCRRGTRTFQEPRRPQGDCTQLAGYTTRRVVGYMMVLRREDHKKVSLVDHRKVSRVDRRKVSRVDHRKVSW